MAIYRDRDWWLKGIGAIALTGGLAIGVGDRAFAQITPDTTLGAESSVVTPNVNVRGLPAEVIEGGATRGTNLFHSFDQFNVGNGQRVYFANPAGIETILGRVTGNNLSNILGTLGVDGGANLFLLNPNGIVFGQNAQLDVAGSFVASTANSLIFDNGFEFSATNPQAPPLLTINVPLGLQFGANPGSIVNQSIVGLAVQPGRTLALVGGEVALQGGSLFAPDGRIELGSVAGNNRISLTPTDTGYALNYGVIRNFQDIRLMQEALVFTDGDGGGSIQVQGRNLTVADGSQISASLLGAGKGRGLSVNASESVQVIGRSADGRFPSGLFTVALRYATGEAGELKITTSQLLIQDGAIVSANNFGSGKGGNLTVNASDSVQVIGTSANGRFSSGLFAQAQGAGDAGDLMIVTGQLLISEGAQVSASTFGTGKGGNLTVNASDSLQVLDTSADGEFFSNLAAQANRNATGAAGDLSITTNRLLVSGGAQVSTGTFGAGKGGNLTINASDSVQLLGSSADGQFFSLLSAQANRNATGAAGDLSITTTRLLISEGAQVNTGTFGTGKGGNLTINASDSVQVIGTSADNRFFSYLGTGSYPNATGDAGDLSITTNRLLISDGATVATATAGTGKGGNLTVNASDSVQVIGTSADGESGSYLSTQAAPNATGAAGDLSITTGQLLISDGAQVDAATFGTGKGGNLTINASESVQVLGISADGESGSYLSAQAKGTGDAGDLSITTNRLLISDGATVATATAGAGKGGNLTVNASESVQVIGTSADGEFGSTLSTVQAAQNATGNAGDLSIITGRLLISDGARVSTGTFGAGKGGNLTVNASEPVQVIGTSTDGEFGSKILTQAEPNATGDAGDLSITTAQLLISNGAQVSASTFGTGKGGNLIVDASQDVQVIGTSADGEFGSTLSVQTAPNSTGDAGDVTITTPRLLIRDGAQVRTLTSGAGKGGNLTVNASEEVQLIGITANGRFASGLFVSADAGSTAGNLSVETGRMSVRDGAAANVSSTRGQAGNMTVAADSLLLNRGRLFAVTGKSTAEGGANIILQGLDILLMGNESLISANAREDTNGGNVAIDSTLIVTTSPEGSQGSDITANAQQGRGGRINITTQGLFGIEFRDKLTPFNDITASSEAGFDGEVIINQPDVDPSRGLAQLPTNLVDAAGQIDRTCTSDGAATRSSFVVTGRGGIPSSPLDPLDTNAVVSEWVTLDSEEENINDANPEANLNSATPQQFVEAQGWVKTPDGQVMLVAQGRTVTPHTPWSTSPACQALQSSANEINATPND